MTTYCPNCGNELPNNFKFCGYCGEALGGKPEGHPKEIQLIQERSSRRLVTVLFADLANFTRAAESADPEIVYHTIRNILEQLAQIIKKYGGRVDRYYGDGFLATFGIPDAHEDDHHRALMAAIETQEVMTTLRRETQKNLTWDLQLRVGINIGPVILGQLDTGSIQDTSVFGHVVNLASRLQSAARPGTILVSETVCRQSRDSFSFLAPVVLQLKGIDHPVVAYELVKQRTETHSIRGLKGRATPLIGRKKEQGNLIACLERLQIKKQGAVILITGEAGIGKSRLVDEILPTYSNSSTIIRSQGSLFNSSNYAFIFDILKSLGDITQDSPSPNHAEFSESGLTCMWESEKSIQSSLYSLITQDTIAKSSGGDPKEHHNRIKVLVRKLFSQLARRQPLWVVYDDIQWGDKSSIDVLSQLIDLAYDIPLGFIFIARSQFHDQLPDFLKYSFYRQDDIFYDIELQALDIKESNHLVDSLLHEAQVPIVFKNMVYARSGGNPFFIEELVRFLLDEAIIYESSSEWALKDRWKDFIEDIPQTVNGLLLNRYDHQPSDIQVLLDMAAVLGPRFPLAFLAATLDMQEDELKVKVIELEKADLLRSYTGLGSPIFAFRHVLLQEAIYNTILKEDRKILHKKAAETLKSVAEKYYLSNAMIGYHLERGGSIDAIPFLLKAAAQSAKCFANDEAISYYQRIQSLINSKDHRYSYTSSQTVDISLGLGEMLNRVGKTKLAIDQLMEAFEQSKAPPLSNYRLGDIHYQLGRAHYDHGNYHEALSHLKKAANALQKSPDECQSFSTSDTEREIGWVLCRQGKLGQALPRAKAAIKIARDLGDLDAEGSAHKLLASIYYWNGQLSESIKNAESSLNIREKAGDIWRATSSHTTLGHLYHQIGQWPLAERILRQAIDVQREIGDYYILAGSLTNLGLLLLDMGHLDEALECMNEAISIIPKHDFPLAMTSMFFLNRGIVLLQLGKIEGAFNDFEMGLQGAREQMNNDLCALANAYLAEAYIKSGQLPIAETRIRKAEKFIENAESVEVIADFFRIQSYLYSKKNDFTAAISANLEAQKLIHKIGNQFAYARLLVENAQIFLDSTGNGVRDNSRLRVDAENALDIFQNLGAEPGIRKAEEILYRIIVITKDTKNQIEQYPTAILVMKIIPSSSTSAQEKEGGFAKIYRRITNELNEIVSRKNEFLVNSPAGVTFVLTNVHNKYPEATRGRMVLDSIDYALSAIASVVRSNNIYRHKIGFEIEIKLGLVIGSASEVIKDGEQAALFASISQLGRRAQALAEYAPSFHVLLSGEIPQRVYESYTLDDEPNTSDDRLTNPIYRLGEATSNKNLPLMLPKSSPKLVGRNIENSLLKQWIDQAKTDHQGKVIYIEAEAGYGKSRLLSEIKRYAGDGFTFLHGKCESFRSSISYWPLTQVLLAKDFSDSHESQQLKSIMGLYFPDEPVREISQDLPSDVLRKEIFSHTREFLLAEAKNRPVIFVFEDIHDVDLASLDLINFLLPLIYESSVSLMIIARAEMPGPHRSLVKKAARICNDRYLPVSFTELTREDSYKLIKGLLQTTTLPDALLEIIEPFLGHPLSLEEIIRFLIEGGWLRKSKETWKLVGVTSLSKADMPKNYRDLLIRRLDFLDHDTLHVVQAGALLGETFDKIILGRMIPRSTLSKSLSELCEKGWLRKPSDNNPMLFQFNHTLTREKIYSTLVRSKKLLFHQRAGEAYETLYPETQDENLELLAYHFGNSGLQDKFLHYAIHAAEKCARLYALDESYRYYHDARNILEQRNQSNSKMMARILLGLTDVLIKMGENVQAEKSVTSLLSSITPITDTLYAACLRRWGETLRKRGRLDDALEKYIEALDRMGALRDSGSNLMGGIIASNLNERLDIYIGLSKIYFTLFKHDEAESCIQQAFDDISDRQHSEKSAELLNILAGIAHRQGDYDKAFQLAEKCRSIYQAKNNRGGISLTYSNMGILAALKKDYAGAYDYFTFSLDLYKSLGDFNGIAIATNNLGQLEIGRGNYAGAIIHLEKSVNTARRSELSHSLAQALANLGFALTLFGNVGDGLDALNESKTVCEFNNYPELLSDVLWKLTECLIACDELDAALATAKSMYEKARDVGIRDMEIQGLRILARANRKMGKLSQGFKYIQEAWKSQENIKDWVQRTQLATEYALCLSALGYHDKAKQIFIELENENLIEPKYIIRELATYFPSDYQNHPGK